MTENPPPLEKTISSLNVESLFSRYKKILYASYGILLVGVSLLFYLEYSGIKDTLLRDFAIHFKMQIKILEESVDSYPPRSPPSLTPHEIGKFIIFDRDASVIGMTSAAQSTTPNKLLASNLPKEISNLIATKTESIGELQLSSGYWSSHVKIPNAPWSLLGLISDRDLQLAAFYDSIDTILLVLVSLTLFMFVAHWLIRIEFVRPSKILLRHIERESRGPTPFPSGVKDWSPWFKTVSEVFSKNRHLMSDLEKHVRELDQTVLDRTVEIQKKSDVLQEALQKLRTTQEQMLVQEKMAGLGTMTAGIAHEMKNPLNFIINFSDVSHELMTELREAFQLLSSLSPTQQQLPQIKQLLQDLQENMHLIQFHGHRADDIVKSMLLHASGGEAEKEPTDINALLTENLSLATAAFRSKNKDFNLHTSTDLSPSLPLIKVIKQELGRVLLNIINNALHALSEKKKNQDSDFQANLHISTHILDGKMEMRIRDNGPGIPQSIRRKIFEPFFTTKDPNHGTGLGLSMSYELIVQHHGGKLSVESEEGQYTEFTIRLPVDGNINEKLLEETQGNKL